VTVVTDILGDDTFRLPSIPARIIVIGQYQSKAPNCVMITAAASGWEYVMAATDQSLKRQCAFNGGKHG
jgi:hypothetical protein